MNRGQLAILSLSALGISAFCFNRSAESAGWVILGLAVLAVWLSTLFSDKYASDRWPILGWILGLPLTICVVAVLCLWLPTIVKNHKAQISLPVKVVSHVTGRASLDSEYLSGSLYNGTDWDVARVRFSVTVGKETRQFDDEIQLAPKKATSFSVYTGMPKANGEQFKWNIAAAYGRRLRLAMISVPPPPDDFVPDNPTANQADAADIRHLLEIPPSARARVAAAIPKMRRRNSVFWLFASSDNLKSDLFLRSSLGDIYADDGNYMAALSEFEKALKASSIDGSNDSKDSVRGAELADAYHSYLKDLRELDRYGEAATFAREAVAKFTSSFPLSVDRAAILDHLGKTAEASRAWSNSGELLESSRRAGRHEYLSADYLFTYSDRESLGLEEDEINPSFFEARAKILKRNLWTQRALWTGFGAACLLFLGIRFVRLPAKSIPGLG